MNHYVLGFMFSNSLKEVALIKKTKPLWQVGFLNGIGGKVENDECFMDAMIREFEEEAGLKTISNNWTFFARMSKIDDWSIGCYYSIGNLNKLKTKTDEIIRIVKVSNINRLKVISGCKWLIPLALDNINSPINPMTADVRYY